MRGDVPGFAIDTDIISGVLSGIRPQRPAQLIDPSPDFRIVRALGQTFTFKGDKQRRIIEYMYQQLARRRRSGQRGRDHRRARPCKTRVRDISRSIRPGMFC